MHFITRAMPIDDIDSKSHKMELKSSHNYLLIFLVKIMPLVIYGLRGVQTHICMPHENDFKKPSARLWWGFAHISKVETEDFIASDLATCCHYY